MLGSEIDQEGDLQDLLDYNIYRRKQDQNDLKCFHLGIYGTINGYHYFRKKPNQNQPLYCVREPQNPYDKKAIKVLVPHHDNTSRNNAKEHQHTVGRVSRKLTNVIADLLDSGEITHLTVFFKGTMHHGMSTDFGEGPKLECIYFLEFQKSCTRFDALVKLKSSF